MEIFVATAWSAAARLATENKKLERAAERARAEETRQATGPVRRKRPRL